jgi:iron(III) transport system permease protein
MLWDTPAFDALIHSLYVSLGAATFSTLLSVVLSLSVEIIQIPGRRMLSTATMSLVLVPIYVQATAWSAGFGDQSWLRWNQVTAAQNPNYAILACIWIQAANWLPLSFLLTSLAFRRSLSDSFRVALIDRGLVAAFFGISLRNTMPWLALAWLLITVLTTNDMVVTNLFRVPTVTETVYQQVQFQKTRTAPLLSMFLYATTMAVIAGFATLMLAGQIGGESVDKPDKPHCSRKVLLIHSLAAWSVTACFIGLPVLSLVIKAGWHVTQVGDGIERSWRLGTVLASLRSSLEFLPELQWSLEISGYASLLALVLALGGCAFVFAGPTRFLLHRSAAMVASFTFFFALPGPLVNWCIQKLLVDQSGWLGWLGNDTLAPPIFGLQTRCVPVVFAILWTAAWRWEQRFRSLRSLDGSSWWNHWQAWIHPLCMGVGAAFFVSFANLESYLLVLPPSVTPVSMRMFELLHYGVQNKDAGLAMVLILVSIVATYVLCRRGRDGGLL